MTEGYEFEVGLTIEEQAVINYTNIKMSAIRSESRKGDVVRARHLCMYFHKKNGLSLKSIGIKLNRDHSTVVHGIKSVKNKLNTNKKYREMFSEIEKILS